MNYMFNRGIFDQVDLDSASLTVKTTVVHRMNAAGDYAGQVSRNNRVVGYFRVSVNDGNKETVAKIDLAVLDTMGQFDDVPGKSSFSIATGGYCILTVGSGNGGYVATLSQPGNDGKAKPYSTRELVDGDTFAASLLRPGVYTATNMKAKSSMEITVPYPRRTDTPQGVKAVSIECSAKGMSPSKVDLQAGSAALFTIKTESSIRIELRKAIDVPDTFKGPEDVPKSVERKALAVLNSSATAEFLAGHMDTGRGKEKNKQFAEKILQARTKTGGIESMEQLFQIEKVNAEEFTKIVNSLHEAHTKLVAHVRIKESK